ncbi:MAG: hypothetical protein AB9869_11475 [Verrucomicrobiia bacterium]
MRTTPFPALLVIPFAIAATASERFRDVSEPLPEFIYQGLPVTNAVLVRVGVEEGIVRMGSGLARIRLETLPEPARGKYFNRDLAASANAERRAKAEAARSNYTSRLLVAQEQWKQQNMRYVGGKLERVDAWPEIKGAVSRCVEDGLLVSTEIVTKKSYRDIPTLSGRQRGGAYSGAKPYLHTDYFTNNGPSILVLNLPKWKDYATGDRIQVNAKRIGTRDLGNQVVDVHDYGQVYQPTNALVRRVEEVEGIAR